MLIFLPSSILNSTPDQGRTQIFRKCWKPLQPNTDVAEASLALDEEVIKMELEPYFVKALKLLHSRHPESADQLKQMLLDVLVQKKVKTEIKVLCKL